ncbi:hypothetical protein, partial [Shewanella sp. NIFS-20-20]|uniref:hypothetical protein n=1 Tax=Shewanella sp. NIFS-20-20 TaxID=2853806 RepID=UPI001C43B024
EYVGSGTNNSRYLLANEQSSIIAETSSTGSVLTVHRYGPFGDKNVTSKTLSNGVQSGVVGGLGQQATKEVVNGGVGDKVSQGIDDRMGKCLPANPHC